jgi:hypothetical protein
MIVMITTPLRIREPSRVVSRTDMDDMERFDVITATALRMREPSRV